mmetsp:Transcript_54410/g.127217  ORF Transcript_54410/g.127217 Transcript_54410/m.127217 type:complete len:606 (+) Transcript_54410:155-1972(+)
MGGILSRVGRIIRDYSFLRKMLSAITQVKKIGKSTGPGEWTVCSFWEECVWEWQLRPCIRMGDQSLTFNQVDRLANSVARAALELGVKPGDTVGFFMPNSIDYIVMMIGMSKIAVTCALLNTNTSGESLKHCLKECNVSRVFSMAVNPETIQTMQSIQSICPVHFVGPGEAPLAFDYRRFTDKAFTRLHRDSSKVSAMDPFLHIFTSGTEGLPKAAKINHLRFYASSLIFQKLLLLTYEDVIYCPLPFYHSSAIVLGLGLSWHSGAEFVIREKFSASEFWSDCAKYNVSVIQYIGELCRYLVNTPPGEADTKHRVRMAIGNGLRADVWERFQERFKVKQIAEFYAATEGNFGFVNTENKVGAVGFLSPMIKAKHPGKLIRYDHEKGEPYRNEKGWCVECDEDEAGELIGAIDTEDVTRRFDGYTNKSATDKKMLTNVFKEGDCYFRSGDLLWMDWEGFLYFKDRLGDTFRWKGENVSTTEVELCVSSALLSKCEECAVFGVEVPKCEGKAGMLLVKPGPGFDLAELYSALDEELPEYAQPCFLRVSEGDVDATATFKHRKRALAEQGFDPTKMPKGTSLYFRDDGKFTAMDAALYQRVVSGQLRL